MSDLIKGFQPGEEQKKSWFQETKEKFLQHAGNHPALFLIYSGVLGSIAVVYFADYATEMTEKIMDHWINKVLGVDKWNNYNHPISDWANKLFQGPHDPKNNVFHHPEEWNSSPLPKNPK